jgi:hypothetical protein
MKNALTGTESHCFDKRVREDLSHCVASRLVSNSFPAAPSKCQDYRCSLLYPVYSSNPLTNVNSLILRTSYEVTTLLFHFTDETVLERSDNLSWVRSFSWLVRIQDQGTYPWNSVFLPLPRAVLRSSCLGSCQLSICGLSRLVWSYWEYAGLCYESISTV